MDCMMDTFVWLVMLVLATLSQPRTLDDQMVRVTGANAVDCGTFSRISILKLFKASWERATARRSGSSRTTVTSERRPRLLADVTIATSDTPNKTLVSNADDDKRWEDRCARQPSGRLQTIQDSK
jgi:hypothetical protein